MLYDDLFSLVKQHGKRQVQEELNKVPSVNLKLVELMLEHMRQYPDLGAIERIKSFKDAYPHLSLLEAKCTYDLAVEVERRCQEWQIVLEV